MGSKPGSQEKDFIFRPENRRFSPLDKICSGCQGWRHGNSTFCVLTWYGPSLIHRQRRFENQKFSHLKIDENQKKFGPQRWPKKSMCHHLPPTFDGFSTKNSNCRKPKKVFGRLFFVKSEKMRFLGFSPLKSCFRLICIKQANFSHFSDQEGIKNIEKHQIILFWSLNDPKKSVLGTKY